jgi:diguanylate cyclase (GGDEF)-like protein
MVLLFSAFALYTKAFLMIGEYEPFSKRILNVIALAGLPFAALAYFAQAYGEAISLTYALIGVAACIPALITKLRDRFINAFLYLPILCLQILALIINYEFLTLAYGLTDYFVALNIILQLQATVITFEIIYRFSAIILQAKSYQRTLEASVRRRTEELAVMAKSLREKNEELAEASRKDPLTGLSNRRHFNELSSMLLKDSSRNETPVSVLVIDADHFKSVNDTWGHDVGDEALKAIAQALRQCVKRPMDIVARFGGEEFVIILHNTELPGAIHVARNIQETLRGLPVQNGKGGSFTLTLSVGVLVAIPGTNADADSLIKVADGLVYDAKKAGRDCICYSESGGGNSGIVTSGVRAHNAKQRAD